MSLLTVTIPNAYGYVLLTATATSCLNIWHTYFVGIHRRRAAVPYPNAYASASEAAESTAKYQFNCAQRAHSNFLEALPSVVVPMLIAGIKYPIWSAGMGAVWCVSRVLYAYGYVRTDKKEGRGRYAGLYLGQLSIVGCAVLAGMVGWGMVTA